MNKQFEILQQSRKLILKSIENLTIEQLNKIPEGFNNNIVWNVAHLVVTQQLLCYKLSELECLISNNMIEHFQKGTFPKDPILEDEFLEIKKLFLELPNRLEEDYKKQMFKKYFTYKTSVNITLNSIEDGITFNAYHEGIHLGIILQLLKFI
jgi:hypothetical protein